MNNNIICLVNVHCLPFVFTTLTQTVQKITREQLDPSLLERNDWLLSFRWYVNEITYSKRDFIE